VIHHFEVDGVPAVFAQRPGPFAAGLVFRVGWADETLARHGVTHLVEHLALHRSGVADHHINGATAALHTHFLIEGTEQEVDSFLLTVCQSLTSLPMERLETEKDILRTEEAGRGAGAADAFGLWRYGAQGHGLCSYPEWGLRGLDAPAVQQWADTWFTRGNAMLWLAGEYLPAGLRLPLKPGSRMPVPAATSALPTTPAWFSGGQGQVLHQSVLPRSAAASLYAAALDRALFQELRQDGGYSYTATAGHAHRGDGWTVVTALADALPEQQDAVLGGFVDVLARLAAVGVPPHELDVLRQRADQELTRPDADAGRLAGYAADLLSGLPVRTLDELRAELWAVTPADVHAMAGHARADGLLRVPSGRRADWAGYTAAPTSSTDVVAGRRHRAREKGAPDLMLAPEGVSLVDDEGAVTVRYGACAAVLAWPDGSRRLIGTDGITLQLEPDCYQVDAQALAMIDAAVPPGALVRMPPRSKRPSTAAMRQETAAPTATFGRGQRVLLFLLTAAAWILGAFTGLILVGIDSESLHDPAAWFLNLMLVAIDAALVRSVLRRRKRRKAAGG
jgi:predicted Zn-dependent peptidase